MESQIGPRSRRALVVGNLAIVAAVAVLLPLGPDVSRTAHALLLIVPVALAGVIGGRAPAAALTAESAVVLAMFMPPFGLPVVDLGQSLMEFVLFLLVAGSVGVLVTNALRIERERAASERGRLQSLEQNEVRRKVLLRSVSHDLRTPLATIRAAASDLTNPQRHDDDTRAELLGIVIGETERLDRIVANLLSLNRIEAGALLPDREPLDLEDLARSCVDRLDRVLEPFAVSVVTVPLVPLVDGDHSQIDQVVTNLIENAARHAPHGTAITITLQRGPSDTEVTLSVEDQGPGFPDDRTPLFEPFASATGAGSSGIGLALCRAIVEAHGGRVELDDAPSGGAVVRVILPRHA